MSFGRFLSAQREYFSPYYHAGITALSDITQSILSSQIVVHGRSGYQKFFQVFALWDAPQTREILQLSLQTNILDYLLPVLVYRRTVDTIAEYYAPDSCETWLSVADYTIISALFIRLYLRRLADNTFYTACLPRAIAGDVNQRLIELLSDFVPTAIAAALGCFMNNEISKANLKKDLQLALKDFFEKFLAQYKLDADVFKEMVAPLKKIFEDTGKKYIDPREIHKNDLAGRLALLIANEFASLFSTQYQNNLIKDIQTFESLLMTNMKAPSNEYLGILNEGFARIKPFLPVEHSPPCGCDFKKLIHAEFASPLYYTGNHLFTALPALFLGIKWISAETFFWAEKAMIPASILLYGQCLIEYVVSLENHCTGHRYMEFARNKAYSFGVGLAFYTSLHTMIKLIALTTGVESFFVKDALAYMLMQIGVVSMLAFNTPLPGDNKAPWDLFRIPRELMRDFCSIVHWLMVHFKLIEATSGDGLLLKVYRILASDYLRYAVDLIFSDGNLNPRAELLQINRTHKVITEDPRKVLFKLRPFKLFYQYYADDLQTVVTGIKKTHNISNYVPVPLLWLPYTGALSIIADVLLIMKKDVLNDLLKKKKLEELLAFYDFAFRHTEVTADEATANNNPDEIKDYPESETTLFDDEKKTSVIDISPRHSAANHLLSLPPVVQQHSIAGHLQPPAATISASNTDYFHSPATAARQRTLKHNNSAPSLVNTGLSFFTSAVAAVDTTRRVIKYDVLGFKVKRA